MAVLLNAARLDFDQKLSFSSLSAVAAVTRYDDSTEAEMVERVKGMEIVITKEIAVPGSVIRQFPSSVRIICEAGTGFNNIDLAACKERGIVVCNVPAYSTTAVAQLVITFVLNFSCSLMMRQQMLLTGDRSNFTGTLTPPHFELEGKVMGLIGGSGSIGSKVGFALPNTAH